MGKVDAPYHGAATAEVLQVNPNLSGEQFYSQSLLFDNRAFKVQGPQPSRDLPETPKYMQTIGQEPNRVPNHPMAGTLERSMQRLGERQPDPSEEFLPTWDLVSPQERVSTGAVNHLTEYGDSSVPNINVVRGEGINAVYDGNHRLNAALRRGQMFIPANVFDVGF